MVAAVPQEAPARVVQYPTIAQESQYIAPQYPLPQYTSLPSSPSSSAPPDISQQQMIEIGLFLAGGAILIMILEQFVQMGALLRGY
jgi:hypothetical protein